MATKQLQEASLDSSERIVETYWCSTAPVRKGTVLTRCGTFRITCIEILSTRNMSVIGPVLVPMTDLCDDCFHVLEGLAYSNHSSAERDTETAQHSSNFRIDSYHVLNTRVLLLLGRGNDQHVWLSDSSWQCGTSFHRSGLRGIWGLPTLLARGT